MNNEYVDDQPMGVGGNTGESNSIMKLYSLGEAATNMEVGQRDLYCIPKEARPNIDGEVTDMESEFTTTGVDAKGGAYATNVVASNAIKCTWLSRNPWILSPGLVRRGEEVLIWRIGDTDQYLWELMGTTNHLRRKDIMALAISNTGDESTTELTPLNSVYLEVNTVDKYISITTPDNDGEPCGFNIQVNMADGTFAIADTLKNAFAMDGPNSLIQMKNSADTSVKLTQGHLEIEAPDKVSIKTPLLDIQADDMKMAGSTLASTYPSTTFSGSSLGMSFSNGNMDVGAMGVSGGSVAYEVGSLTHNGKNIGDDHYHKNVKSGSDNSGPVG